MDMYRWPASASEFPIAPVFQGLLLARNSHEDSVVMPETHAIQRGRHDSNMILTSCCPNTFHHMRRVADTLMMAVELVPGRLRTGVEK